MQYPPNNQPYTKQYSLPGAVPQNQPYQQQYDFPQEEWGKASPPPLHMGPGLQGNALDPPRTIRDENLVQANTNNNKTKPGIKAMICFGHFLLALLIPVCIAIFVILSQLGYFKS